MMRVLGDKVLVALPPQEHEREETTGYDFRTVGNGPGGIIVAQRADSYSEEASTRGIVMQLGEKPDSVSLGDIRKAFESVDVFASLQTMDAKGRVVVGDKLLACKDVDRVLRALAPAPFDVQVGDCVLFAPSAGNAFEHDGINYVLLREDELLAVLEPQKADAA